MESKSGKKQESQAQKQESQAQKQQSQAQKQQSAPKMDQMTMTIFEDKLNELYHVVTDIEDKTSKKNELKSEIMILIKQNNLQNNKFAIGNKYIKYKVQKTNEGLSQKFLLKALQEYPDFKNDQQKANDIYKHILNSRTAKTSETLDITKRN